jgi:hypothetical protein
MTPIVAKFVEEVVSTDPDTNLPVHLAVYKHENGGMFAMDSSFIEHVAQEPFDDDDITVMINDPFAHLGIDDPDALYLIEE